MACKRIGWTKLTVLALAAGMTVSAMASAQSPQIILPGDTPDTWAEGQPVQVSHDRHNDRYDRAREIRREACEQEKALHQLEDTQFGDGHFWSGIAEARGTALAREGIRADSKDCASNTQ